MPIATTSRLSSFSRAAFPNCRAAAKCASSADAPSLSRSLSACSLWNAISAARSSLNFSPPRKSRTLRKKLKALPIDALLRVLHHAADGRDHLLELRKLRTKLFTARRSQGVITCTTTGVRLLPLSLHPSLDQQSLQRRIQGSLFYGEYIVRQSFDREGNAVAVQRTARERFQDEHIESAGQKIRLLRHAPMYRLSMGRLSMVERRYLASRRVI